MKRNLFVYIGLSVCAAVFLAFGVWVLVAWNETGPIVGGVFLLVFAVSAALLLGRTVMQDNLNIYCGKLCDAKRYAEERALIEKKMGSPFFFLIRPVALTRYIRVCMALDDLPTAKRYIDSLRHGGGAGWKYKTAYFYILILLDGGEREAAYAEYGEFRTQCAHAKIYADQLAVLTAIFHRVYGTSNNEPLPQEAVNSVFPVVGRVLGRIYEARAEAYGGAWD